MLSRNQQKCIIAPCSACIFPSPLLLNLYLSNKMSACQSLSQALLSRRTWFKRLILHRLLHSYGKIYVQVSLVMFTHSADRSSMNEWPLVRISFSMCWGEDNIMDLLESRSKIHELTLPTWDSSNCDVFARKVLYVSARKVYCVWS